MYLKSEKHIFKIEDAVMDTLTREEVDATAQGMEELGILRMPYNTGVHIRLSPRAMSKLMGWRTDDLTEGEMPLGEDKMLFELPISEDLELGEAGMVRTILFWPRGTQVDPVAAARQAALGGIWDPKACTISEPLRLGPEKSVMYMWETPEIGVMLRKALIVILAARGYSKTETGRQTKLQKLQGKNKNGTVITHIGIDQRLAVALGGTHASPRMHLRRGHPRRFRNGAPLNPPKWIEATLVCADADFIATRTAYTVH
jgi:hypothetical protein